MYILTHWYVVCASLVSDNLFLFSSFIVLHSVFLKLLLCTLPAKAGVRIHLKKLKL